nr:immunoglobulin light chain junction region [Macaca mulatta]
CQQHYSYPITF